MEVVELQSKIHQGCSLTCFLCSFIKKRALTLPRNSKNRGEGKARPGRRRVSANNEFTTSSKTGSAKGTKGTRLERGKVRKLGRWRQTDVDVLVVRVELREAEIKNMMIRQSKLFGTEAATFQGYECRQRNRREHTDAKCDAHINLPSTILHTHETE